MNEKIDNISILLAEDEDDLRDYFVEYLQIFFTKVYAASNGLEAFNLYLSKKPNIVIADINMPNIDGLTLIRKIRDRDKECKIVILSAHSDQEKLLDAIELNLVKYLIKPIQSDTLKELLFSIVEDIYNSSNTVFLGDNYRFDKKEQLLYRGNELIALKEKEKMAFSYFISREGDIVSAQELYSYLHKDEPHKEFSAYAITSLMKRLRSKIPKEMIVNQYGLGYKLVVAK